MVGTLLAAQCLRNPLRRFDRNQQLQSLPLSKARRRRCTPVVQGLPFDPPSFNPSKVTVAFDLDAGLSSPAALPILERRYTLTHNDITGSLLLTVGRRFSALQLSGWYIQLLRDEVLAEWIVHETGVPQLHVYCHVSGQERWPAPPQLRNYIFKREMPLVLDTLAWAEREMIAAEPEYAAASVLVHFTSNVQDLHCTVEWGRLGFRDSWRRTPSSILQRLLNNLPGFPAIAAASSSKGVIGSNGTRPLNAVPPPCGSKGISSNSRDSSSSPFSVAGSSSSSSSSSSWRVRFLARLDDSVDYDEFVPLNAVNDPYSELQQLHATPTEQTHTDADAGADTGASATTAGQAEAPDPFTAASATAAASKASRLQVQQGCTAAVAPAEDSASKQSATLWMPPHSSNSIAKAPTAPSQPVDDSIRIGRRAQNANANLCDQQEQHDGFAASASSTNDGSSSSSRDDVTVLGSDERRPPAGYPSDSPARDILECTTGTSGVGGVAAAVSSHNFSDDADPKCQEFVSDADSSSTSKSDMQDNGSHSSSFTNWEGSDCTDVSSGISRPQQNTKPGSGHRASLSEKDGHYSSSSSSSSSSRQYLRPPSQSWHGLCAQWPSSSDCHAVACSVSYDELC